MKISKIHTSSNRFSKRKCPNCKEIIIPIYIENKTFYFESNFKDYESIPEELRSPGFYPAIDIFGCPKCRNIFFDYQK